MIFLLEREVGYATDGIGFPSIMGCIAMVYQTQAGIFGFHNAGNSGSDRFDGRAKKWADWVKAHPNGSDTGVCLYGVTYARNNERGYTHPPVEKWKAELKTFANRLQFKGALFGYDLTHSFNDPGRKPSVYIEFRKEGGGYSIFVRPWYNSAQDGLKRSDYVESTNYKNLDSSKMKEMTTDVDRGGLIRVFPERLGGL
jgi:hypothetical protein